MTKPTIQLDKKRRNELFGRHEHLVEMSKNVPAIERYAAHLHLRADLERRDPTKLAEFDELVLFIEAEMAGKPFGGMVS